MAKKIQSKSSTKTGRKRDREGTEKAILKAAGELFAKKGYENTRTLEIAKAANANEALITRYFGGKEGLLKAILTDPDSFQAMLAEKNNCHEMEALKSPDSGLSLEEAVADFLRQGCEVTADRQQFMRIACSRSIVDAKMAGVIRQQILDKKTPVLMEAIYRYVDRKKVSAEEIESAAMLILSCNFQLNFMGRHIYHMGDERVNHASRLLAQMLGEYFRDRAATSGKRSK